MVGVMRVLFNTNAVVLKWLVMARLVQRCLERRRQKLSSLERRHGYSEGQLQLDPMDPFPDLCLNPGLADSSPDATQKTKPTKPQREQKGSLHVVCEDNQQRETV